MSKNTGEFRTKRMEKWKHILNSVKTNICKISETGGIASASSSEFVLNAGFSKKWGYITQEMIDIKGNICKVLEFSKAGELPRLAELNRIFPVRISNVNSNGIKIQFITNKDLFLQIDDNVTLAIPSKDFDIYLIPAKVYYTHLTERNKLVYGFLFEQSAHILHDKDSQYIRKAA